MNADPTEATRRDFGYLRPGLIGSAAVALLLAVFFGWDWLAAAGLGGLLVSVAPCLAMCALGLCIGRKK